MSDADLPGWLQRAGVWLRSLIERRPLGPMDRALLRLQAQDWVGALPFLDAALAAAPTCSATHALRSWARLALEDYVGCAADTRRVIDLLTHGDDRPGVDRSPEALAAQWNQLACCLGAVDDEPGADACWAEVERLAAAHGGAPLLRRRAVGRAARLDLEGALADLDAGGEDDDLGQRAMLLRQLGRLDEAVASLRAALRCAPDAARPRLLTTMWRTRAMRGDKEGSELTRARWLAPHDDDVLIAAGVEAVLQGDRTAARAAFAGASCLSAWHWSACLALEPGDHPPGTQSTWQQAITDHLLAGAHDDDALLARARVATGLRHRSSQLAEAHVGLALIAAGRGQQDREVHHLHAAAAFGDHGGSTDTWVHARARQLGSPVPHLPPRVAVAT